MAKEEKNREAKTLFFLILPLLLIVMSVGRFVRVAKGTENAIASLDFFNLILIINMFSLILIVVLRDTESLDSIKNKNLEKA